MRECCCRSWPLGFTHPLRCDWDYTCLREEITLMSSAPKMAEAIRSSSAASAHSAAPAPLKHEEIAQLAYSYWVGRGRPCGSPEEDWFRAEQDLLLERLVWSSHPAGSGTAKSGESP